LENDRLIRKYGYVGSDKVLALCKEHEELRNNLSTAAHLIHGSSEGRFTITYCAKELSKSEIESVGFNYLSFDEAIHEYGISPQGIPPRQKRDVLFINNPAIGLWIYRNP
jgi:hypothetical protein